MSVRSDGMSLASSTSLGRAQAGQTIHSNAIMRIKLSYLPRLSAAGVAAAAIVAAPTAMANAAGQHACAHSGVSETKCHSPGNVQINDSPRYPQYTSQYPYREGDVFDRGGLGTAVVSGTAAGPVTVSG